MDRTNEQRLCARVAAVGESADASAIGELADFTRSASARVRRLAASAIGKLAGIVLADQAVDVLLPLLQDAHPQCRQYAAKALGAFGTAADKALPDLRDLYRNPTEKEYVKRTVLNAGKTIREAIRVANAEAVHNCRRCGKTVAPDEYARSRKAFQRVFCDNCFDEVYLDRRNFDTKVELNKTIRATDGTLVQSDGERIIAEWLTSRRIAFRYDERFRILEGYAIRPDFYLPEFDVYIEYWGMDTADYKIGMLKKQKLYQQQGKRLVSLYARDKPWLTERLAEKLGKYARAGDETPGDEGVSWRVDAEP
jgi:hypothetical protein